MNNNIEQLNNKIGNGGSFALRGFTLRLIKTFVKKKVKFSFGQAGSELPNLASTKIKNCCQILKLRELKCNKSARGDIVFILSSYWTLLSADCSGSDDPWAACSDGVPRMSRSATVSTQVRSHKRNKKMFVNKTSESQPQRSYPDKT